jgi:hypothetical protein
VEESTCIAAAGSLLTVSSLPTPHPAGWHSISQSEARQLQDASHKAKEDPIAGCWRLNKRIWGLERSETRVSWEEWPFIVRSVWKKDGLGGRRCIEENVVALKKEWWKLVRERDQDA